MKKITKIIFTLLGVSVFLVTACTEDPVTRWASPEENNNPNLIFFPPLSDASANNTDVTVSTEATSYTYKLFRSNTEGSITIPLISESDNVFNCPSTVTFEDGSATADVIIRFSPLTSEPKTVKISIDPQYTSLYAKGHPLFIGTIKAINWISLGNGQFYDTWVMYNVATVEVKKAEGMDRYRIMNPYPQAILEDADWGDWIGGPKSELIEFWIKPDKTIAWDGFWYPGLLYYADPAAPLKHYLPSTLGAILGRPAYAEDDAKSKVITANKLFLLHPYIWIDGVGGWLGQDTYLSLPEGPDLYEYLGL
ncbi:MAG: hypothetical protein PHP30_09190 [Bacteroidales bacterium]|nr:hypothetical protein [Bacteroidales bacterium]MDD2425634.1 hypothetical protein [Bacteroidales bacterium]MDD3990253.1 hypothetical protein [Bacteroidales bacterium]